MLGCAFLPRGYFGTHFGVVAEVGEPRGPYGRREGLSDAVSIFVSMSLRHGEPKGGQSEVSRLRLTPRRCANARPFVRALRSASVSCPEGTDRGSMALTDRDVVHRRRVGDVGARLVAARDADTDALTSVSGMFMGRTWG